MQRKSFRLTTVLLILTIFGLFSFGFTENFFTVKKNIEENSWRKISFIYLKPSLMINDVGYSSNIYSFDESKNPDWTADVGVKFLFSSILGKRIIVRISETPYYSFYLKNKKEENLNNKFEGTLFTYLGNINIKYSYSFGRFKSRPTTEFGLRTNIKNFSNNFKAEFGNQRSLFTGIYYRDKKISYEDNNYYDNFDLSGTMDKKDMSIGGFINIPIFTKTRLFFAAEYFKYAFINEYIRDGIGEKVYMELKFPDISIISGSFSIGFKYFKPTATEAADYIKPVGTGKISVKLLYKLKFNLEYSIDNYYSFWQSDAYYDHRSIMAGVDFYITKKLRFGYRYGGESNLYRLISGEKLNRDDKIERSEASLILRVNGNTGIGLKYTFFKASSSIPGFGRNYSFIGGYITHEF